MVVVTAHFVGSLRRLRLADMLSHKLMSKSLSGYEVWTTPQDSFLVRIQISARFRELRTADLLESEDL